MNNFSRLRTLHASGKIARDDFWRQAYLAHSQLADYCKTLRDSDITAIQITPAGLSITLKTGVSLLWNPEDIRSSANTLVNHGHHEAEDSPFLLAAAKNKGIIFDIGANAGYYAIHFARLFNEIKEIHAFEPIPETYETLVHNVAINGLSEKIRTNNLALGNRSGEATFYLPDFSGSCAASLQNLHPEECNQKITTKITTLDQYCESKNLTQIDLIKIDVEGAEYFLLEGALETLKKFKPTLFVEILRKWSRQFGIEPNQTIQQLTTLGYHCWTVEEGQLVPFREMTETTPQTNFFFTHPDREPDPTQWNSSQRS